MLDEELPLVLHVVCGGGVVGVHGQVVVVVSVMHSLQVFFFIFPSILIFMSKVISFPIHGVGGGGGHCVIGMHFSMHFFFLIFPLMSIFI